MATAPLNFRLFVISAPGLEDLSLGEVSSLEGISNPVRVHGGVEASGGLDAIFRANLWLRTASRVLVRAGEVPARDFDRLRAGIAGLAWSPFLADRIRLRVTVSTRASRLYHTGAIAERVRLSLGDLTQVTEDDTGPLVHVFVRGVNDVFTISVDSSGALLHRRGYREETAKAPLRETIAAGILLLAGWDPLSPLVDPMCGSGTLILEAAHLALGRAPGARREFAFQSWPCHDRERFAALVANTVAREYTHSQAMLMGSDRDPGAIAIARRNAERAALSGCISFTCCDVANAAIPKGPPGLIICNPPFGKRVLCESPFAVRSAVIAVGNLAKRAPGWRLAVLCPTRALAKQIEKTLRRPPLQVHSLRTGGLDIELCLFPAAHE